MRIHVCAYDEIALGPLCAEVHYVLDEVLDVTHFLRDATDNPVEQPHLLAVLLAYVGDVNYGGDRLRREIQSGMWDARVMGVE